MKKPYLLTALLLSTLMLAGCGDEKPSTGGDTSGDTEESVKTYNLQIEDSIYASEGVDTKGNDCEIAEGSETGVVGTTITLNITVKKGFEIRSLTFNGEKLPVDQRTFAPKEGDNLIEIVFCEIGYNVVMDGLFDFTLSDAKIAATKDETINSEAEVEDLRKLFFDTKILAKHKADFAATNVYYLKSENADNYPHYIKLGSSKNSGSISFKLDEEMYTKITSIEVEVMPFFNKWTNTSTGESGTTVDHPEFSIDGINFKTVPVNENATKIEEVPVTKLTFTEKDCAKLNGVITMTHRKIADTTSKGRCYIKSLKINLE